MTSADLQKYIEANRALADSMRKTAPAAAAAYDSIAEAGERELMKRTFAKIGLVAVLGAIVYKLWVPVTVRIR